MFTPRAPRTLRRVRPAPQREMEASLGELRKDGAVGGLRVGAGGSESTFHSVARALLAGSTLSTERWFLEDDYPAVRALGFLAAARRGDTRTLTERVCERDAVTVCPYGCVCSHSTIGAVAQEYLWSPAFLVVVDKAAPPPATLSEGERTELALRIGAADGCTLGSGAAATLQALKGRGLNWLSSTAAPRVPTWLTLKAVARMDGAAALPILVTSLDDGSLPARTRLTAASALTLSTANEAEVAITRSAAFLDATRPGLSAALLATIQVRRDGSELMKEIEKATTWMETEKLASNTVAAYGLRHPLVVELVGDRNYGARDADVKSARRRALLWTADHLSDHTACWDMYRNVAYDLERMLGDDFWSPLKDMSPEERAGFEAAVRAATTRLDADVSCLE